MKTLADIIRNNADKAPDHAAIVYNNITFGFGEYYERALKLANALASLGCNPHDRIAVLTKNCIQYLEIYAACELAGFVVVPVNFRLSPTEAVYICNNTTPAVCFYGGEFKDHVDKIMAESTEIRHFFCISEGSAALDEYDELMDGGKGTLPSYTPGPDDPACIVHTSGTTGRPKGAVLSQGALWGIAQTISEDAAIQPDDYGLVMQPLFHVGARFLQLSHHCRAATIQLEQGFEPANVWQILLQGKITTMQLVPTMLDMLLDELTSSEHPKTSLRTIFYSTAPINESLLRRGLRTFGQVFIQQYGSTEGGQITSLAKENHIIDGSPEEQRWLTSAGTACPGTEIRIVDQSGKDVTPGEAGEIIVKHPNIMQGYWNDEKATRVAIQDGYLHMGDIGYLDGEGFLYIVDRKKDMIISGGENIYPREVETALNNHPAVIESAVIGIPDERWGEAVLAVVVCKVEEATMENTLIEFCKTQIASYKKPKKIHFVDELPRIATGKVDKVSLRKPYWSNQKRSIV